jgi:hypothetical protein
MRILQQLFIESVRDMDEKKPVRRLLVIPEMKDESGEEENFEDENKF